MPREAHQALLANHVLLGQLDESERKKLLAYAHTESYRPGEVIFHKGDPGTSMMTIVKGRVKISANSPDGREVLLAVLGEGEILGEMAIFEEKDRSADAIALEATELLIIHRREAVPFLERNPKLCLGLLAIMSARLRRASELMEDRAFLRLPSRLAKTLLNLAEAYGEPTPKGIRIGIRISQKDVGALLGVSRESINKQLHAWRDADLITIDRGFITLSETSELERLVDALT